jgi:hypothetical protein
MLDLPLDAVERNTISLSPYEVVAPNSRKLLFSIPNPFHVTIFIFVCCGNQKSLVRAYQFKFRDILTRM